MNEPITQLDTRHGVPRGEVTPWEQTRRVLETAELAEYCGPYITQTWLFCFC